MCGICGIYNYKTLLPARAEQVEKMYGVMRHRGPDGHGSFADGPIGLGHCRLSILDTSSRGSQPMKSEDGSIVIVFNGEIYNFIELRELLAQKGYVFRTGTDTEVIIQMYREFGEKCLDYFVGMFAFALWDAKEQKLFLVRDRLGVKPLYYLSTPDGILFGSEVKSILEAAPKRPVVQLQALDCFMSFGYVPGERSLFEGVLKLSAGHYMIVSNGKPIVRRYWDLVFSEEADRGEAYYVEKLREILLDASRIRLRSDVPLGVFLSGGLDSSSVVALLARELNEPIKTFSVAYDKGGDFDETHYSRIVARKFHTDHHEFYVDPAEFRDFIPKFVWFMDEPVTEAAAISLYFIAKLARDYVTVVLSGEGADEMFAGYPIYHYMKVLDNYRRLPQMLREGILNPLLSRIGGDKVKKYLQLSENPLHERYTGVSLYEAPVKQQLYTQSFKSELNGFNSLDVIAPHYKNSEHWDPLNRMLYLDIKTWLVDDILIKADRMSMAPSLELRSPFLDHRIAEFAASLPVKYKLNGRTGKYILKKSMEGILPPEIIYRKKKGFPTPLETMFKHELNEYAVELLTERRTIDRGYFDPGFVARILDEHTRGARAHHKIIWQLIVLEEWHRCFADAH